MATSYPIRAVAKLTGISPDTLRAWERRYQAVVPERSGRGRQYGQAQIDRLVRLNRLVKKGHAIGGIAALSDAELTTLLEPPASRAAVSAAPVDLLRPALAAIESFDAGRVSDELGRLAAVLAPRDFVHLAVVPLMREVGTRWYDGRFAIAQEHLVSQALRNLLGGMIRLFRPSTPVRRMVVATPVAETHEFGILAASMLASMSGIEAVYLGADLPAAETARVARLVSAEIVLLGITVVSDKTPAEVATVAAAMPAGARLWLGGAGAAELNLSLVKRPVIMLADLQAFEHECQRSRP